MNISYVLGIIALLSSIILIVFSLLNPIVFKLGIRNSTRRIGNTILVVIGCMIGTALISGSFVLSDSLDSTFKELVKRDVGEKDLIIIPEEKEASTQQIIYFNKDQAEEISNTIKKEPDYDGVLSTLELPVSPTKLDDQDEPVTQEYRVNLIGITFKDIETFGQDPVSISYNRQSAIISQDLANQLEATTGDNLRIPYGEKVLDLKITDIIAANGIVESKSILINKNMLAEELDLPSNVSNRIYISTAGGIEPKDYNGKQEEEALENLLADISFTDIDLRIREIKAQALNGQGAATFATIFTALSFLGVFAGILLINNLYSMLADERKREMGLLRAIAFTKPQLFLSFLLEGYTYSLLSSLLGSLSGLGIGYLIVISVQQIINTFLGSTGFSSGLELSFNFELSSLINSFLIGLLITIATTIISSIKITQLSIVEAIRDLKPSKNYNLNIKTILRLISNLFLLAIGSISFFVGNNFWNTFENLRDQYTQESSLSEYLIQKNTELAEGFLFVIGGTLTVLGIFLLIQNIYKLIAKKERNRLIPTLGSILMILFQASIDQFDMVEQALAYEEGSLIFFINGLALVFSATILIAHNLDILAWALSKITSRLPKFNSIINISFKYPKLKLNRTANTMIMFAIVIYLVIFIGLQRATINTELDRVKKETLGTYSLIISATSNATQEDLENIETTIERNSNVTDAIQVSTSQVILPEYKTESNDNQQNPDRPSQVRRPRQSTNIQTRLSTVPYEFLKDYEIKLSEWADKYTTEEEVWKALNENPDLIILGTSFNQDYPGPAMPNIEVGSRLTIESLTKDTSYSQEVIGRAEYVITKPMLDFEYNLITSDAFRENKDFSEDYYTKYGSKQILTKVNENDRENTIKDIKNQLVGQNINSILSLGDLLGTVLDLYNSITYLFQGFLAFSLLVGSSGLAIIIMRSVNERRQQIGMLRALGYQKNMILSSFFIETSVIALLSIGVGVSMGVIGALNSFYIAYADNPDAVPQFPVQEIVLICIGVYIVSILFSLKPALDATKLEPVEATNYPE